MEAVDRSRIERARLPLAALLLFTAPAFPAFGLAGQEQPVVEIRGLVIDAVTGDGVAEVAVLLSPAVPGARPLVRFTDSEGSFLVVAPAAGLYDAAFMRFGYRTLGDTVRFGSDGDLDVVAEMVPEAVAIDPVVVTVEQGREVQARRMDGFYQRRRSFPGDFVTRSEIDRIGPEDLSHLLVQAGPFRMVPGRPGERSRVLGRGGCAPSYYLDGAALTMSPVDMLDPNQLEAMEVYRGSFVPAEFQSPPAFPGPGASGTTDGSCGTVVLWTRDGERARRPGAASSPVSGPGRSWIPAVWVVAALTGTYLFGR